MAEFPALPLFTDAYLGDTTHLSTIEHGAYMLLLMVAWRSQGCALPDDDDKLAKYARLTRGQWQRIAPTIREFFTPLNGQLIQRRLTDEHEHVRQVRESQRANGKASALKRKGRHSTPVEPSVDEALTPSPSPTPTLIPDTNVSSPALQPEHVMDAWNEMAGRVGLPMIRKLSPERKRKVQARIRGHPLEEWMEALDAIERSPFLRGETSDWRGASFDFLLQPSSFQKLIEGNYDRGQQPAGRANGQGYGRSP